MSAAAAKKILLAWSSGKDSAWMLHVLRGQGAPVAALLSTINEAADRVAMHGVRRTLAEAQAGAAALPLWQVPLPWPCSNEEYEARMADACRRAVAEGFDAIAFGDLYLADIRAYREKQLAGSGLTPLFPLWQLPTDELARKMIAGGLRARLACIDTRVLDESFAGREFDASLLDALPSTADPCGENGEFHTFAYAGPMFRAPLAIETGERHAAGDFLYTDLQCPASSR
ncbi:MAG: adenine nucleotide alpha hydrolase [Acidobacteria bacterium]|nr:adenine nucleotide alpha hydrolase [Acidobacteriota bacterium]